MSNCQLSFTQIYDDGDDDTLQLSQTVSSCRRTISLLLTMTLCCASDGLNNVTRSLSVIYEWVKDAEGQGQGRFKDVQSIEVVGARDWTHFTVDSYHFLVVASARSEASFSLSSSSSSSLLSSGQQYSVVYFWHSGRFIPFQTIEVCRCVQSIDQNKTYTVQLILILSYEKCDICALVFRF